MPPCLHFVSLCTVYLLADLLLDSRFVEGKSCVSFCSPQYPQCPSQHQPFGKSEALLNEQTMSPSKSGSSDCRSGQAVNEAGEASVCTLTPNHWLEGGRQGVHGDEWRPSMWLSGRDTQRAAAWGLLGS